MDWLFGSIRTACNLLKKDITVIATLKSNRKGLPAEIKSTACRDIPSILTLFHDEKPLSLHSYVIKTKSTYLRNVLLLSTHNVFADVTKDEKMKPYIYKVYDYTKGGVDVAEGSGTTSCKSNRWTNISLCHVLDCCRINGKTIFIGKNSDVESREYSWNLAMALAKPLVQSRNINGLQQCIRTKVNMFLNPYGFANPIIAPAEAASTSDRCSVCIKLIQGKDHKTNKDKLYRVSTKCSKCYKFVCKKHTVPVCSECH